MFEATQRAAACSLEVHKALEGYVAIPDVDPAKSCKYCAIYPLDSLTDFPSAAILAHGTGMRKAHCCSCRRYFQSMGVHSIR